MTIDVTLTNVGNLQDTTSAQTTINANNTAVVNAFETAYNTTGDKLLGTMDANSNQIINLPTPATVDSPARLIDVVSNPTIQVPPTGTSGATVPFLNGNNTWSGTNTFLGSVSLPSSGTVGTPTGAVRLVPALSQTVGATHPWLMYDPWGNNIPIASTTTSGLQEAINYATSIGAPLEVIAPRNVSLLATTTATMTSGSPTISVASTAGIVVGAYATGAGLHSGINTVLSIGTGSVTLSQNAASNTTGPVRFADQPYPMVASSQIVMPPLESWSMYMYNVYLGFSNFAGPAWKFDSCMTCNFNFNNCVVSVVGQQTSCYAFSPTNPVLVDNVAVITSCNFDMGAVAFSSTTPTAAIVLLDPTNGSIGGNRFKFGELNGSGSNDVALQVNNPGGSSAFWDNIIEAVQLHSILQYGLLIGNNSSATSLGGNLYRIGGIQYDAGSPLSTTYGIASFGSYDIIDVGQVALSNSGTAGFISFGSNAVDNQVRFGRVTGNTVSSNFTSGSSGNILIGGGAISLQGTAYTNP